MAVGRHSTLRRAGSRPAPLQRPDAALAEQRHLQSVGAAEEEHGVAERRLRMSQRDFVN